MAPIRQSRPDSSLVFPEKVLTPVEVIPSTVGQAGSGSSMLTDNKITDLKAREQ